MFSCWIDTEKGAIWGFVAPMLAIIFVSYFYFYCCCKLYDFVVKQVNIIFLLLALCSLYTSRRGKMTVEETSQVEIVKYV